MHGVKGFALAEGADEGELARAERALGMSLPEDVTVSWWLHDGGLTDMAWVLTYGDLLPLKRMVSQWQMYCVWAYIPLFSVAFILD